MAKNALKLERILAKSKDEETGADATAGNAHMDSSSADGDTNSITSGSHGDCLVKAHFAKEDLVIRHKNGLTLAVRQTP
jgi:hypothetical protein